MGKLNRKQVEEKIDKFFSDIGGKSQEQVRKMKKLAMSQNVKLKEKRKFFCQRCYSTKLKTLGIKNKIKRVQCGECGKIARWKIKA